VLYLSNYSKGNIPIGLRYINMISDGDSSAYEYVKHTYVDALSKDLSRSKSDESNESDRSDERDSAFPSLSVEQYENNLVMKEDCINHVKKRVSNQLKTLKNQFTGFETVDNQRKKRTRASKDLKSALSADSSDDDEVEAFVEQGNKKRTRKRLPDGKPYGGGAGRMTKAMEHKLSEHYGLAIRQSSASVDSMLTIR
jgi:hypothetical protein